MSPIIKYLVVLGSFLLPCSWLGAQEALEAALGKEIKGHRSTVREILKTAMRRGQPDFSPCASLSGHGDWSFCPRFSAQH